MAQTTVSASSGTVGATSTSSCSSSGYDGAENPRRNAARSPARYSSRPRFVKNGRGRLSGRSTGSRLRTDTTSAPDSRALRHSVAAAIPAPITATLRAYSCGSYACT